MSTTPLSASQTSLQGQAATTPPPAPPHPFGMERGEEAELSAVQLERIGRFLQAVMMWEPTLHEDEECEPVIGESVQAVV